MDSFLNKQLSSNQLLEAQAHVWNHIFNFINSMSLKCAVQLCIPEIIHKHAKPITFPELINALPINKSKSHFIFRLMRILTHSGFFINVNISEDKQGYWLTPSSLLLLKDHPLSLTPFLLFHLDPFIINPFHHLSEWLHSEDSTTQFSMTHGMTFWEFAKCEPWMNQMFNEAMASDAKLVSSVLVKDFKQEFEGFDSLVDVGGGTGMLAKFIADALPELKCSVLDLPQVIGGLEGSKNLSYVVGDMFVSIPPANILLLKWILHDWNDEECVKILKNCKEALIPSKDNGGKVMIIDMVLIDNDENKDKDAVETQLFFDIIMMSVHRGRERTEKDWAKLFSDAGFTSYRIFPILGLRSLIQLTP